MTKPTDHEQVEQCSRGGGTLMAPDFFDLARAELARAREKFGPINGPHEGYAVLLEEVDELWDAVKTSQPTGREAAPHVLMECIQVAAMAGRFAIDLALASYVDPRDDRKEARTLRKLRLSALERRMETESHNVAEREWLGPLKQGGGKPTYDRPTKTRAAAPEGQREALLTEYEGAIDAEEALADDPFYTVTKAKAAYARRVAARSALLAALRSPEQQEPEPFGFVVEGPGGVWGDGMSHERLYPSPPLIPDPTRYRVIPLYAAPRAQEPEGERERLGYVLHHIADNLRAVKIGTALGWPEDINSAAGILRTGERVHEALNEVIAHVSNARRDTIGEHDIYTVQIDVAAVERWRAALSPGESPTGERIEGRAWRFPTMPDRWVVATDPRDSAELGVPAVLTIPAPEESKP